MNLTPLSACQPFPAGLSFANEADETQTATNKFAEIDVKPQHTTMTAKNLLRWLAIAGFGGYGIYTLADGMLHGFAKPGVHWAVFWFFILPFMLVYCGLFIAVAYFVLRRQYRHLVTLISGIAAVVVCSVLLSLPRWFGIYESCSDWSKYSPWVNIIALPISFAALLIPFYAAGWAYRRVQAFLSKHVHENAKPEQAA